jgi:hypothetical protein
VRFRPAVEDILELLIDERLVRAKPDARTVLDRTREHYRLIQLRAAVRSHPHIAFDELAAMGWIPTTLQPSR